jgi:hypothetical protein
MVQVPLGIKQDPILKVTKAKRAGILAQVVRVAQVVEQPALESVKPWV